MVKLGEMSLGTPQFQGTRKGSMVGHLNVHDPYPKMPTSQRTSPHANANANSDRAPKKYFCLRILATKFATPLAPYRSLPGPPGPESRKSLKRVSRGLPAPGSQKCPKQSQNSLRSLKTVYPRESFRVIFNLLPCKAKITLQG